MDYLMKTGGNVLELGCGTGRVSLTLASAGFSVTGLDLSDTMLEIFDNKLLKIDDEVSNKITLVKGIITLN